MLHPRLLFSPEEVPALKAKLTTPAWRASFQGFVSAMNGLYGVTPFPHPQDTYAAYYAFIAQTHGVVGINYGGLRRADYETKAKTTLMGTLTSIGSWDWSVPLTYDMVYDVLTSAERQKVANRFKNWWANFPTCIFSTGPNSMIAFMLLAGLAIHEDGLQDAWAQSMVDAYPTRAQSPTGFVAAESLWGGKTGGIAQGQLYGTEVITEGGTLLMCLLVEEAYRRLLGHSKAEHYLDPGRAVLRYAPRWCADLDINWPTPMANGPGGKRWTMEKSWASSAGNTTSNNSSFYSAMTALTGLLRGADDEMAGLARWLQLYRIGGLSYWQQSLAPLMTFIHGDRSTPPVAPKTIIPVSARRDDGRWILRTDWSTTGLADQVTVSVRAPKWLTNLDGAYQADAGFEVFRRGPQIVRCGVEGHDSGGNRSTSWNIVTFPDKTRTSPESPFSTCGGMRMGPGIALNGATTLIDGGPCDLRDEVDDWLFPAHGFGFDYTFVDWTRAYPSTRYAHPTYDPVRVRSVEREFVFLRPKNPLVDPTRIVVFDRTETVDTKFEKRWLLHFSGTPIVTGHSASFAGPARGATGTDGKETYEQPTLSMAVNKAVHRGLQMNGRTWLTPILPEQRRIVRVGGPNGVTGLHWCGPNGGYPPAARSHELEDAYGTQGYENVPADQGIQAFTSRYRLEVIPSVDALFDAFCHAIETADASGTRSQVDDLSTETMMGAAFLTPGDFRAVVTARQVRTVTEGRFTLPHAGTYGCLVSGVNELCTLHGGSRVTALQTLAVHGQQRWLTVTVSSDGAGPENDITIADC